MAQTLSRSGIVIPSNDGSDSTAEYRISMRALGNFFETYGMMFLWGTLAARPAAGIVGRLYKPSDPSLNFVAYFDNGTTWDTIGASAPTDPIASIGGLRTLGGGAQQAAAGNHGHARDVFDFAGPGVEAVGLLSVGTTVAPGTTTIVAGPSSGRRIVKALVIDAPTAGTTVTLTLAGTTLCNLMFTTAGGGGEFALTLPLANTETLQATVTGGTVTFLASYVDRADAAVDRFGFVNSSGSGSLVLSSGSARVVSQILVANSTGTTSAMTVTFAGTPILSGVPLPPNSMFTLDLPRPLPAGQAITYAGDGITACTVLAVGHS